VSALTSVCLLSTLSARVSSLTSRHFQGAFRGEKPLLVLEHDIGDLFAAGIGGGPLFGATAVILVRSEAAKRALPLELQSSLVLTVEL
jgi:hypothetical protein